MLEVQNSATILVTDFNTNSFASSLPKVPNEERKEGRKRRRRKRKRRRGRWRKGGQVTFIGRVKKLLEGEHPLEDLIPNLLIVHLIKCMH